MRFNKIQASNHQVVLQNVTKKGCSTNNQLDSIKQLGKTNIDGPTNQLKRWFCRDPRLPVVLVNGSQESVLVKKMESMWSTSYFDLWPFCWEICRFFLCVQVVLVFLSNFHVILLHTFTADVTSMYLQSQSRPYSIHNWWVSRSQNILETLEMMVGHWIMP